MSNPRVSDPFFNKRVHYSSELEVGKRLGKWEDLSDTAVANEVFFVWKTTNDVGRMNFACKPSSDPNHREEQIIKAGKFLQKIEDMKEEDRKKKIFAIWKQATDADKKYLLMARERKEEDDDPVWTL